VRAGGVEPEDRGVPRDAAALHGELDPVLDRGVLGLAHAPDVTGGHLVLEDGLVGGGVDHAHGAGRLALEGLVVAAVLLGLCQSFRRGLLACIVCVCNSKQFCGVGWRACSNAGWVLI